MEKIEKMETSKLTHFEGNPRFDSMINEGLFADIEQNGILVPILVSPAKKAGFYEVIDGERRRKSALKLNIPKITCIIEDMDEQTKHRRAYDLNALNRPFSPMEIAKNFYLRMTKFHKTAVDLAGGKDNKKTESVKSSFTISSQYISKLVALNRLPQEIQDSVHTKEFPVDPAYELSQLAFDISFPNIGQSKSLSIWLKKNLNKKWDFTGTELKKWAEDRVELQETLFDKWINNKLTTVNLKIRVDTAIKNEKERREWESKQKVELEAELQKLKKEITPTLNLYNDTFKDNLIELIPEESDRKSTVLNKYIIDKKNLPKDVDNLLYEFVKDINEQMPNDDRMKTIRNARNNNASFRTSVKNKDPTIFKIKKDPACSHCGHNIDVKTMDDYFDHSDKLLKGMEQKKKLVSETREHTIKGLRNLFNDIGRIKSLQKSLKKLKEEENL